VTHLDELWIDLQHASGVRVVAEEDFVAADLPGDVLTNMNGSLDVSIVEVVVALGGVSAGNDILTTSAARAYVVGKSVNA